MIKREYREEIYLIALVLLGLYLSLIENIIPKPFPWRGARVGPRGRGHPRRGRHAARRGRGRGPGQVGRLLLLQHPQPPIIKRD